MLWLRVAKKRGKRYGGVFDPAARFMTRWHGGEAEKGWLRHATEEAKSNDKGEPWGREKAAAVLIHSCRRIQKRCGRSCGKVTVELISGTCATVALNATVRGSFSSVCVC